MNTFLLFHLILKILVIEMNHSVETNEKLGHVNCQGREKSVTIPTPPPKCARAVNFSFCVLILEHLLSHSTEFLLGFNLENISNVLRVYICL